MVYYSKSKKHVLRRLGLLYFYGFTTKINCSYFTVFSDKAFILKERQKLRFCYGLTKKQLVYYFKQIQLLYNSFVGFNLILLLERRLDSCLIKLNIIVSLKEARQLIIQKRVFVNKICIIYSIFVCNKGDIIHLRLSINLSLILWRNIINNQNNNIENCFSNNYKNSFKFFRFVLINDFNFRNSRLKIDITKIPSLFIK